MNFFLLILIATTGVAIAAPPYNYVSPDELRSATTVEAGEATGDIPAGIAFTWLGHGANLRLTMENTGTTVAELLWDRSAFVDAAGLSSGIVPGSTIKLDVKRHTPPSVVPPGARIEEDVIRESAVGGASDSVGYLVEQPVDGQRVGVTIAVRMGDKTYFFNQPFKIGIDYESLDAIEQREALRRDAARLAAERARREDELAKWEETYDLHVRHSSAHQRHANIWGSAGIGLGVIFTAVPPLAIASDPNEQWTAADTGTAAVLVSGALIGGATGYLIERRKMEKSTRMAKSMEASRPE